MRKLIYVVTAAILTSLVGCEKYALDRQMEELCKKDGGLKVYETVTLPRSAFDATGYLIRQRLTDPSKPLTSVSILAGGEYSITSVTTYLAGGEPSFGLIKQGRLSRYEYIAQRISDKKVLGTEVSYGRIGGEVSLGHPSSNSCPKPRPNPGLNSAVFKMEK
jgi:hypothetical protein